MKKFHDFFTVAVAAVLTMAATVACGDDDPKQDYNPLIDDPKTEEPTTPTNPTEPSSNYRELFRPQIHYTPARNWMNDPNGMVYQAGTADGSYHLFYQYNPQGNVWGNMSWGHATSTDLIHWTEQPVALTSDALGAVFSGSCVIDRDNTAGFGAGAMIALYTSAGETGDVAGKQQQSLAYSTDGGKTFTRYTANPVIRNNDDNLRDPKVFWHEASRQWVMVLAKGWAMGVELYGSADLKSWQHLSTFVVPLTGRPSLQWECPDLIQMGDKWVMIVSVNPGGPIQGSGTMYFVGQFDGKEFIADNLSYPLWLDYGADNYAGVTWSNTGSRHIMIGWMNNWSYAGDVPCSPWRSAMTLPRELKLIEYDHKPLLCSTVVKEIENIATSWQQTTGKFDAGDAYQLRITVNLQKNSTITLSNDAGEEFVVDVIASSRTLIAHRRGTSGQTKFNGSFSIPSMQAPLSVEGDVLTLDFFVDQSSVELFTKEGTLSMTNLVFPQSIYNTLSVGGNTFDAQVRQLKRIW